MSSLFYPMLLKPCYETHPWGGVKIAKNRQVDHAMVSESWEISDNETAQSIVENGTFAGKTLHELCGTYPTDLVGPTFKPGSQFPLSIKISENNNQRPMQVNPSNEFCENNPNFKPKTEVLYVLENDPDAFIYAGLNTSATQQYFIDKISDPCAEDLMQRFRSRRGDAFFIPTGRIFSIGAGHLIYNIQENSTTTFNVCNWNHTVPEDFEKALQAIHFTDRMQPRIAGDSSAIVRNMRLPIVDNCPCFTIEELRLTTTFCDDTTRQSFHTLFSTNADFEIVCGGESYIIPAFRTVLLPAAVGAYRINVTEPTLIIKAML